MKAPLPPNEAERLAALRAYGLIDTEPERDFDELVALAARLCECPVATVTLVDQDRQWFKARVGTATRETHRDLAFCAHAILEPEAMTIVPDARNDARFADNPLVLGDPWIRFYAGMPLVNVSGAALGTFCVLDQKPRELTPGQVETLAALGRQAARLMELRRVSAALARALGEVKVLEGLLPTCCHCKSIRDERGQWHPLEIYLMDRSRTQFTHGICPDCAKERYPDLDLSGGAGVKP